MAKLPPGVLVPGNTYQLVASSESLASAAAQDWASKVPELKISIILAPPAHCANCIYTMKLPYKQLKDKCFGVDNAVGCTIPVPFITGSSLVVVASDLTVFEQEQVWQHELGHAMGLEHAGPQTVMCFSVGCEAPTVTANDVMQWRLVRGRL